MKRVWLVTVTVDVPVLAEHWSEAEVIALREAHRELPHAGEAHSGAPLTKCPSDLVGCLPHGGDGHTTIDEYIKASR